MKKLKRSMQIGALSLGVWMLNPFLHLLYLQNRELFYEFIASGAQMYTCVDWDASGQMIDGVCYDPMPTFPD